jgi:four helix bundle protein
MNSTNASAYKNLIAWQKSLQFADAVIALIDSLETDRRHYRLYEQLEAAVTSVPMNIAEGRGRDSKKEFTRFLYISRGSLFETLTLLEIFKLRGWISDKTFIELEQNSIEIAKLINGLIRSLSNNL